MNKLLMLSSVVLGIILSIKVFLHYQKLKKHPVLIIVIVIGILTSILNHSSKSKCLKYIDRIWMIVSLLVIADILKHVDNNKILCYYLLIISVLLYLTKYFIKNNISHLLCHIVITLCLILIIQFIQ